MTPRVTMIYSILSQKHQCKAFFDTNIKCNVVDDNLREAFNGRRVEARCKAIVSILEDITIMVMNRMHNQRDAYAMWTKNYGLKIMHKLYQNTTTSSYCHQIWIGDQGYKILKGGDKSIVDLSLKTCYIEHGFHVAILTVQYATNKMIQVTSQPSVSTRINT